MSVNDLFYKWLNGNKSVKVTLASESGETSGVTSYGSLSVSDEPTPLFNEPFDTLDTTNRWTAKNSTGTATTTNGALTVSSSTTASAYGGIISQPTFSPLGLGFLATGVTLKIPVKAINNSVRVFGYATVPTTPTTAVPINNGLIFRIDGTGALYAEIWKSNAATSSTLIASSSLVENTDTRFLIVRRGDMVMFFVNNLDTPIAVFPYPNLDAQLLPFTLLSIAGATPPASSATIQVTQFGVGDTSKSTVSISDPTNPFLRATVKKASTAAAAADPALVVAVHPTSVAPVGGTAAHDAAVSGSPVRIAGRALTADYAAVSTGDTADLKTTLVGALVTYPYAIPELQWQYATPIASPITNTTAVAVKTAGAAGIRNYVTGFTAYNNSATGSIITIQDGSTVIYTDYLPANGSIRVNFRNPLRGTAATAVNVVLNTTATSTFASLQGFSAP